MPEEGTTQPNSAPAAPAPEAAPAPAPQPTQDNAGAQAPAGEFDPKDIADSKGIIWMSYLGLLALVPFFSQKDNKYTRKHAVQGLNMCIFAAIVDGGLGILGGVIAGIAASSFSTLWMLSISGAIYFAISAFSGFIGVLSIIGIVNAESGKYKDLPLVSKVKFIKK